MSLAPLALGVVTLGPLLLAIALGVRSLRARAPVALFVAAVAQLAIAVAVGVGVTESVGVIGNVVVTESVRVAGGHLIGSLGAIESVRVAGGHLVVDPTSRLFLVVVDLVYLGVAGYVWNRVRTTPALAGAAARFTRLSLVFMSAANVAVLSNHLLVSWAALEVTTFAAAPLVRTGSAASARASWRYFLFSSAGLAMVLLGLGCLARALASEGVAPTFFVHELEALGALPPDPWRSIGLALVVLGYGTKLGLAPMYSWLPETYDEAPPATTALLAAVQHSATLVCLMRVLGVYRHGNQDVLATELLAMGLASMAVSTVSIVATTNFERLIAYASINHGGVIAIGLAIGKSASYGVLLYLVSNAFIKAILFLTAGRIKAHYGTNDTREVRGLIKDLPYSGVFLMVGTFALLGLPPFGSFLGELLVLSELVRHRQVFVFVVFCTLLALTFVATGRTVFPMIWGEPKREVAWPRQSFLAAAPKLALLVALVAMGVYMPAPVSALFRQVAASLGAE